MSRGNAATVPRSTPPRWVNSMVKAALRTPGLERLIGRGLALITVTGRRTDSKHVLPVSYYRDDLTVFVVTKRFRT